MKLTQILDVLSPRFRDEHARVFNEVLRPTARDRILDVGGNHWFWRHIDCPARITCLNIDANHDQPACEQFSFIVGDGRVLPFADGEYDIVFSNSVIEHVGTFEDQRRFAEETRRAGHAYWVQTPDRWFVIEPHLVAPLIHYLPVALQRRLARRFSIWGLTTRPTQAEVDAFLAHTRLLTLAEMKLLFPDATIYEERFLFFRKSIVAYRTGNRGPHPPPA